jgi:hypothetical protein
MPVFSERLGNLRSWWNRAKQREAAGFLVCSWESYRLAQEMTTVVDAAAASLWLDPAAEDCTEMLARGFARVFGKAHCHRLARQALACDERAFAGYARWEINERWDCCAPREGFHRHDAERRFFTRLSRHTDLPEPFAASVAFRLYLARRDVFVRRSQREVLQARRLLAREGGAGFAPAEAKTSAGLEKHLTKLRTAAAAFGLELREGKKAARRMWVRTRDRTARGQNEILLDADGKRLAQWRRWLAKASGKPLLLWNDSPLLGAWQLQFTVQNFAPAMQRVVVEQCGEDGAWTELRGRYTIEFRAAAARPHAKLHREFSMPAPACGPQGTFPRLRIAVRGLGQVSISQIELGNGVQSLRPAQLHGRAHAVLGQPAPQQGFPEIDMKIDRGALELDFRR